MAEQNLFPDKELEDLNLKIKERVNNVLKNINTDSINQKVKESDWKLLGTLDLDINSKIELSDDANGYVIADVIKYESVDKINETIFIKIHKFNNTKNYYWIPQQ